MSIRSKLLKKIAKRVGSKAVIRKGAKKAMTFAQKNALKKAVKASALARRKATVKLAKRSLKGTKLVRGKSVTIIKKVNRRQLNAMVETTATVKYFKPKKIAGTVISAGKQSKAMEAQLRAAVKAHNAATALHNKNVVRAAKGLSQQASRTTINIPSSIAYSVALTAALNPAYTAQKYKEAKQAVARKLTGTNKRR
jgi:hypothetical protein